MCLNLAVERSAGSVGTIIPCTAQDLRIVYGLTW